MYQTITGVESMMGCDICCCLVYRGESVFTIYSNDVEYEVCEMCGIAAEQLGHITERVN